MSQNDAAVRMSFFLTQLHSYIAGKIEDLGKVLGQYDCCNLSLRVQMPWILKL